MWSNDGTRLFIIRGHLGGCLGGRSSRRTAAGPGPISESEGIFIGECCLTSLWAPDDSSILLTPVDTVGLPLQQVIIDPVAGTTRPAPWTTTSDPTWQRLGR